MVIYVVTGSDFYVRSRVVEQQEADIKVKNVRRSIRMMCLIASHRLESAGGT